MVSKVSGQVQGIVVHPPPRLGYSQAAVQPFKQAKSIVFFQLLQGAGHRRLRHVQRLRRPGHALGLIYFLKNAHVPQRHWPAPPIHNLNDMNSMKS